jgi:hypothetical protein
MNVPENADRVSKTNLRSLSSTFFVLRSVVFVFVGRKRMGKRRKDDATRLLQFGEKGFRSC